MRPFPSMTAPYEEPEDVADPCIICGDPATSTADNGDRVCDGCKVEVEDPTDPAIESSFSIEDGAVTELWPGEGVR